MSRIEDYALLGDLHTGALVSRDGSVDWLCLPRFDSPACFAALLDTPEAGRWRLAPAASYDTSECVPSRSYRGDTLVLETQWRTPDGVATVTDFMPVRGSSCDLVRIVEGVSGSVPMRGELRLRFDYGRIVPWVRRRDNGLEAIAGPDAVWLTTPAPLQGRKLATISEFTVSAGDRVPFVLTWAPSHHRAPARIDPVHALDTTLGFWTEWSLRSGASGRWRDAVQRSLIVLKALTYAPTGGVVAALTTSLPEQIGGPRNWDYRYCWLRDSTYALQALLAAGYVEEARAWREWLLRAVAGDPARLQIMYALDGTRRLPEMELDWLAGYENSKPVRVGNAAAGQFQLDVWGEVLDGLHLAREAGISGHGEAWDLQQAMLDYLEGAWQEPDNGLWEMRGPRRHFVHSKVMAWVAFDRMVRTARLDGLPGDVDRWTARRNEIHADVCARGFDADRGTFTQSYGGTGLDASLLLIPRVGFLPADDPRVIGTVLAVRNELTENGLVLRYRTEDADDGLPPGEGVFLACSFWLVDALHAIGRDGEAVALFERLLALRNDVGLLSEEWDPVQRRQLGNTPQAFSHFPLVVTGLQLQEGRHRRSDQPVTNSGRRPLRSEPDRGS
ncbi:MAG TPA: glycoside hydrolase family 15 protein [Micromonosporaceae bacterium]|jgi:GH15 family glucan-1,4-alpha-glucosidase|nr:glycoside hydrolase family 15 protein [Micromonosporaceae bacterium]